MENPKASPEECWGDHHNTSIDKFMKIDAHVIGIRGHAQSEVAAQRCIISSDAVKNDFVVKPFDASTPEDVDENMRTRGIKWNYPWDRPDEYFGLSRHPYVTKNRPARIACAMSHYFLWEKCSNQDETFLILEHDAKFIRRLDIDWMGNFDILGINNPLGATRKANLFQAKVQANLAEYQDVPWIDDKKVPQGLAGNSAYLMTPRGARKMIGLVDQHGLWPNDALMCSQLVDALGVTRTYYTTVQKGITSTTTR